MEGIIRNNKIICRNQKKKISKGLFMYEIGRVFIRNLLLFYFLYILIIIK
jgi:hypothetical protein